MFCDGDLSADRFAAARAVFEQHIHDTAEIIDPGLHYPLPNDDRPIISLEDWRRQMADVRTEALNSPAHYFDRSPTGAGKSFADRELIKRSLALKKSVLLVVPTHANCREEVEQLSKASIVAVAYPELTRETCQKIQEAKFALGQGLDLARSVCSSCRRMHDKSCLYRNQIDTAQKAAVAVCTTTRLGRDESVSKDRDVNSVHELADSAIREQFAIKPEDIAQASRILEFLLDGLAREAATANGRAGQSAAETQQYVAGLIAICDNLCQSLRSGAPISEDLTLNSKAGYWQKSMLEWLQEQSVSDEILAACEEDGFEWPNHQVDGDTLRALVMIAQGDSWEVLSWTNAAANRHYAKIVVQHRLNTRDDQVWIWQDATGDVEHLERLLGQPVKDITPDGRLAIAQTVEVIPIDVTRKTAVQTVANAIRSTIMHSGCQRLGIIGFKIHIDEIQKSDALLAPELRERIHKRSHYGSGADRGSNKWLECDRLLILGTPRIGDAAIRAELWRMGEHEAAQIAEPGWIEYTWEGQELGSEDDEPLIVAGMAYSILPFRFRR